MLVLHEWFVEQILIVIEDILMC